MRAPLLLIVSFAAACGPGVPGEVIAEGEQYAQGLTRDEAFLYWFGQSRIFAVPLEGGEVVTLAEDQAAVTLTATAGRACWIDLKDVYRIACVDRGGGEVQVLEERPADVPIVRNLAADAEHLYWSNAEGELRKLPLTGGPSTVLASTDTATAAIAVGPDAIFASTVRGIARFNKSDGQSEQVVVDAPVVPQGLALGVREDPDLYWVEAGFTTSSAFILSAPITAEAQVIPLAQNQVLPSDLAVDADYVYWASGYSDAHIRRVPVDGGRVEDFASGTRVSGAPVLDEAHVYWLDFEGRIHRAPK